jgi:hypothetical protein
MVSTQLLRDGTIIQLCCASLSFVSSTTIVFMVRKSFKTRNSQSLPRPSAVHNNDQDVSPYQRLICSLSISDIFQSGALIIGPFMSPKDTIQSPWAVGTTGTCDVTGFLMLTGNILVPLYTLALCIYYLCKVKYRMSNAEFGRRVELKMHTLFITFTLMFGLAALISKTINVAPTGSFCQMASIPTGCRTYPELVGECSRGLKAPEFAYIFLVLTFGCLIGVVCTMATMCWHVIFRERMLHGLHVVAPEESVRRSSYSAICSCVNIFQERQAYETEATYLSRLYLSQVVSQACLYVAGYMSTHCLSWVHSGYYLSGRLPPDWTLVGLSFLYPIGGVFNILVYIRPKVGTFRMRNPEFGWIRSFWLIVKAGGEVPSPPQENRNAAQPNIDADYANSCVCFWGLCRLDFNDISQLSLTQGDQESNVQNAPYVSEDDATLSPPSKPIAIADSMANTGTGACFSWLDSIKEENIDDLHSVQSNELSVNNAQLAKEALYRKMRKGLYDSEFEED